MHTLHHLTSSPDRDLAALQAAEVAVNAAIGESPPPPPTRPRLPTGVVLLPILPPPSPVGFFCVDWGGVDGVVLLLQLPRWFLAVFYYYCMIIMIIVIMI